MATTHISFGKFGEDKSGSDFDIFCGDGTATLPSQQGEVITPTAANQTTTVAAIQSARSAARVATDTLVWVEFGTAPNAAVASVRRFLCPANTVTFFSVIAGMIASVATAP